jgi:hypothetical protein
MSEFRFSRACHLVLVDVNGLKMATETSNNGSPMVFYAQLIYTQTILWRRFGLLPAVSEECHKVPETSTFHSGVHFIPRP